MESQETWYSRRPWLLAVIIVLSIFVIVFCYIYMLYGNIFLDYPRYNFHHEKWMAKLSSQTQLKDIVFPGSHDSLIFEPIKFKTKYANIEAGGKTFQKVSFIPGINEKVNRWTQTQNSTILEQLNNGIRAFDFRITSKDDICYGFHTFLGSELKPSLDDIKTFLKQNPKEIILITVRTDIDLCKNLIHDSLDDKIFHYNPTDNLKTLTLEDLWARNKNVIISDWQNSKIIISDWLNSYDEEEKIDYWTNHLKTRLAMDDENNNEFYNLEWTLTPQTKQVGFHSDSLLYSSYKFNQKLSKFLKTLPPQLKDQINILSIDNSSSFDLYALIERTFY